MSKRVCALLLTALMLLSLCACGASAEPATAVETAKEEPTEEKPVEAEPTETPAPAETPSPMEQLVMDAEAGDTEAMVRLGDMYRHGDGVEADMEEARSWYNKAGEAGNGVASLWLGDTYYFPSGELRDYGKAFEYYSKAAEAGVADAMGNLGVMYGSGYGVEQDYAKAAQWYEKAIDAGCAWAMRNLANYYLYGRGNIGRDEEKGVDLLLRAAETGFPSAYSTLGSYYQSNRKNDKAEAFYLKGAEAGDIASCRALGSFYLYELHAYDKAEEYLLKAGEGGDTNAMFTLGDFYSGVGGMAHRDIDKAIEWYTRSTQTDNPSAYGLFWLGQIYYNGSLVGADYEKAFELLNSAVEIWKRDGSHDFDQPYLQAVTMIGDMYKAGQGVEKNEEKAAEYYAWAKQLASG